jgi:GNAT superfamily N-acetyltransferase
MPNKTEPPVTLASLPSALEFQLVGHGSCAYQEAVALRAEILRKPLGLAFSKQELEAEVNQLHFIGKLQGETIACAALQWHNPDTAKIRQVAVKAHWQGRGIGRQLMHFVEHEAITRGAAASLVHARFTALNFYLALAYIPIGKPFEEIGIRHQKLRKDFSIL